MYKLYTSIIIYNSIYKTIDEDSIEKVWSFAYKNCAINWGKFIIFNNHTHTMNIWLDLSFFKIVSSFTSYENVNILFCYHF